MVALLVIAAAATGWIGARATRHVASSPKTPTAAKGAPVTAEPMAQEGLEVTAQTGALLYAQLCAACHGESGQGQPDWKIPGTDGALPAPPHDATGHTWHHPDDLLLRIIAEGGTFYSPDSKMPAFGNQLSPAEMTSILDTIKGWWGPQETGYQSDRTAESQAARRAGTPTP